MAVSIDSLFQAFEAAGAGDGVVYLSVPITSGRRAFDLAHRLGCDVDALPTRHSEQWEREVLRVNEEAAQIFAAELRVRFPTELVIDPSRIAIEGWTQNEYNAFWSTLIRKYAVHVVAAPDWAFSRGARHEIDDATRLGLQVLSIDGRVLTTDMLAAEAETTFRDLLAQGWREDQLEKVLPPLHFEAATPGQTRASLRIYEEEHGRAAAEVFAWLRGERAYQVQKFGLSLDDEHTREGLGEDGWWWRQLTTYFHRSRVLTLSTPGGRQALAKFAATACGLLESVVRVHGPLPPPGVSSGGNLDAVAR
jgi:hypothetical protein